MKQLYIKFPTEGKSKIIPAFAAAIIGMVDVGHCASIVPKAGVDSLKYFVIEYSRRNKQILLFITNQVEDWVESENIREVTTQEDVAVILDRINKKNLFTVSPHSAFNFISGVVETHSSILRTKPAEKQPKPNKYPKPFKPMEVFLQKTINPKVTFEQESTKKENSGNGAVKIHREVVTKETITKNLERDITLCGYFVPELSLLKIGVAIRNPEFDEFDSEFGKRVATEKAKKTPTFATKFCLDTECDWGERLHVPELSLGPINKHQMIKTLLYEIANDMEKDFGKYVAAYR